MHSEEAQPPWAQEQPLETPLHHAAQSPEWPGQSQAVRQQPQGQQVLVHLTSLPIERVDCMQLWNRITIPLMILIAERKNIFHVTAARQPDFSSASGFAPSASHTGPRERPRYFTRSSTTSCSWAILKTLQPTP